ncbi:hypothetical protein HYS94_00095 [Candidatus Daviesbacteria bacterium]|nr:hypothetical protein [Candidatus Daviesbacteria bacterium]
MAIGERYFGGRIIYDHETIADRMALLDRVERAQRRTAKLYSQEPTFSRARRYHRLVHMEQDLLKKPLIREIHFNFRQK